MQPVLARLTLVFVNQLVEDNVLLQELEHLLPNLTVRHMDVGSLTETVLRKLHTPNKVIHRLAAIPARDSYHTKTAAQRLKDILAQKAKVNHSQSVRHIL